MHQIKIYAMPVFDMLETFLVKKLRFRPGLPLRLIARSLYVGRKLHFFYRRKTKISQCILIIDFRSIVLKNKTCWHAGVHLILCPARSVHSSGWHRRAVLWWVARVLRWLCICANDLLCEILYFLVLNFPPTDSN